MTTENETKKFSFKKLAITLTGIAIVLGLVSYFDLGQATSYGNSKSKVLKSQNKSISINDLLQNNQNDYLTMISYVQYISNINENIKNSKIKYNKNILKMRRDQYLNNKYLLENAKITMILENEKRTIMENLPWGPINL